MENPPPVAPARRFEIAYQALAGPHYNRDFRGRGTLLVQEGGTRFTFQGRRRAMFGRDAELTFAPEQIWNVSAYDRRVQFATATGESGRRREPFVFYCSSADDAAEIAALLPATRDAEAVAGEAFHEQLRQLSGSTNPWSSVTNLIIAANVAMFVVMGFLGAGWFDVADMTPYLDFAANRADATADGEWWRLLTSMFAHYGLVHLLLNMWALLQTGHLLEKLLGRALFGVLYLGGGFAGGVASLLWHSKDIVTSAGASGAVFAVYGGLIGYMLRERQALPKSVFQPLIKSTLAFAGYNLLYGFVHPSIDNAAHLGGLASGVLLGWLLALPLERDARAALTRRRLPLGLAVTAGIVLLGVALAPRFDYRLTDELAWQRVTKEPIAKEPEILKQQEPALRSYAQRKDPAALTRWLDEAIPFYTRWHGDLRALSLEPGRQTAKRRAMLVEVLRMKIEAHERLRAAVRQSDPRAVAAFREDESRIVAEIAKFPARAK